MKNCEEITRLASDAQERPLQISEKLQMHTHLLMCPACRTFYKNTDVLSKMMKTLKQSETQKSTVEKKGTE